MPDENGNYTEQELKKIAFVRLMIGDTPTSPFYPIFEDDEIASVLENYNWDVKKAIRSMAIAASMQFSQMTYRERTGDIEVWNNVSLQYQKALQDLINDNSIGSLGTGLMPYFGGISWCEVGKINSNPDQVRSALTWESHTVPLIGAAATPEQIWLDQNYSSLFPGVASRPLSNVVYIVE